MKKYNEPTNLDEVVQMLYMQTAEYRAKENVTNESIDEDLPHHGFGTSIRNELNLWWSEDLRDYVFKNDPNSSYPKEKPALVKWFNDRNIYHADDMSGTIQAALKSLLAGKTFDFDKHVKRYFKHWEQYGYKDGICRPENKVGPECSKFLVFDDDDD